MGNSRLLVQKGKLSLGYAYLSVLSALWFRDVDADLRTSRNLRRFTYGARDNHFESAVRTTLLMTEANKLKLA